ncbi:hypothetical protein R5R35_011447 [Gryllus longicercus]|uniref:V-type proton ATPase subunit a n=1 Tax=Gryllus longicercus TaxID=2509291 RepID=A0AAN9YYP2_9ORTH
MDSAMGSMFRSEEMALCQLFIQPEAAYPSVAELGESGIVQFRDLNADVNAFQRKFVNEVRRCDELERKLRYIRAELLKDGVTAPDSGEPPRAPIPREIIDLEARLEKTESEVLELSHNAVNLKSNYLELTELRHVLERAEDFFSEQEGGGGGELTRALASDESAATGGVRGRLGFVAGVVPRERVPAFERMLWRISRGNVFLRRAELDQPLEDPTTGNEIFKTVFVAFFQGEQLKSRVKKVCSGFHASLYACPTSQSERQDMLKGVRTRLEDLNLVLNQTQDHRHRVLLSVSKELHPWMVMVRKMKAIYHTLNMFNMDVTKKCLIGECWAPVRDLHLVRQALEDGGRACGSSIPSFLNAIDTGELPPTFHRTNKFTYGFQNLIDSYGVASYREVNPALYTIITFPFLFATMFGDAGHGLILFLFGLAMVLKEKSIIASKSKSEIGNIFFGGRYIILLMGIFSIYTGLIYNDIFSKSINIFGSRWVINNFTIADLKTYHELMVDPKKSYEGTPYPFGMDPIWQLAEVNKIVFLNSYKMKLSIIFGVAHMMFGVCMSVVNHVHFGRPVMILLEFVPQIVFLLLLFGYLVTLMIVKWFKYAATNEEFQYTEACAPSVLITFINMMLFGKDEVLENCVSAEMFPYQSQIQLVCVVVALLCIPVLLLGKPLYVLFFGHPHATHHKSNGDINQGLELQPEMVEVTTPSAGPPQAHEEEEAFGEVMIHQAIHTIEYVLSTISHTASYLRLWALSLAHGQLSEVLWNMVLRMSFKTHVGYLGGIVVFVIFAFWASLTLAILVMMEGLSAFLHTLRLHWVEFMSKFYAGEGYAFQPFAFKSILEAEDEED